MLNPAILDEPHPVLTTTKMQDLAYNAYPHFILLSPTPHVKHTRYDQKLWWMLLPSAIQQKGRDLQYGKWHFEP